MLTHYALWEQPDKAEILKLIASKVHRMCVPDDVVFISEMPISGTGKILKRSLREQFEKHPLPNAPA